MLFQKNRGQVIKARDFGYKDYHSQRVDNPPSKQETCHYKLARKEDFR